MTWSQMKVFARTVRQREVDHYLMLLAIQHNPYHKSKAQAGKLERHLRQERSRLIAGGSAQRRGIRVGELQQAFGKIERVVLTREEYLARQRPLPPGVNR